MAEAGSQPRIAVIATVLNEAGEIDHLLHSLLAQTLPAEEVVIVDGGSTDGTWERLQQAREWFPALRPVRDESCNLRNSAGPIARGRNVAIAAAAHAGILACADGGCTYAPDWLANLTARLRDGTAEYALGGSCMLPARSTVWDIAAAPFLGVKLAPDEPTKSCTARSMAFTRAAFERAGGFPESLFIGEDVLFDQRMRATARTAFAARAKAIYQPGHTLGSAVHQLASYALADGIAGMRPARLMRNVFRCVAEVLAILLLHWTVWPILAVLALETYFAYRLDFGQVSRLGGRVLAARFVVSLVAPWVVAWNQVAGSLRKQVRPNRQNA